MRKGFVLAVAIALAFPLSARAGPEARYFANPEPEKTPIDLFSFEGGYVFESELHDGGTDFGKQDAFELEAEYSHRFHIKGNWYFRAGVSLQPLRVRRDKRARARSSAKPRRGLQHGILRGRRTRRVHRNTARLLRRR